MITLVTERLILRPFEESDDKDMFVLDSNPMVHKYLGENPSKSIEDAQKVIANIMQQYKENGIGRWATIEKSTGKFIGWSGLKFITRYENNRIHFHDVGYRFIPEFWGKGYATESALAALNYGFNQLKLQKIIGMANIENKASIRVLEKCGLQIKEQFPWDDLVCHWMEITEDQFRRKKIEVRSKR